MSAQAQKFGIIEKKLSLCVSVVRDIDARAEIVVYSKMQTFASLNTSTTLQSLHTLLEVLVNFLLQQLLIIGWVNVKII